MKSKPCTDCGQVFPPCVMDFDHLRDKVINVSRELTERKFFAEIAKCELVCANCHRIRTQVRSGRSLW